MKTAGGINGRGIAATFAALLGVTICGFFVPIRTPAPLTFDASNVGGLNSNLAAEYFKPDGTGPFPAVVVMHGCNGMSPNMRRWARRFVQWGYAAIAVDSFRPRGFENVCDRAERVSPRLRAQDAFAAARYLRSLPEIDGSKIAIVGFSHGGSATLAASTQAAAALAGDKPFAAAVAFYPWCGGGAPLASDTLVLIGDADDWTPSSRCEALSATWNPADGSFRVKIYPGVKHAFDVAAPGRVYYGHQLVHDPAATSDAIDETQRFLSARFGL
ncbi:dienelactone hydrolase family protein [Terrarubrum flagellatum]|uniref:dienelactone hydrolase family protein n=1 Tax=Terrirubrum flagellatum TaxID=2895980 RepID=UPI003144FD96